MIHPISQNFLVTMNLFVLISLLSPIFLVAHSNEQKTLYDLRRFKVKGVVGRFTVDRSALEQEIQNRRQQDAACGQAVKLQLPQSLPHTSYDTSHQGEVAIMDVIITDHTLADELSNDLKEQIATSYKSLVVALPVVLGTTKEHGVILIHIFTNSTKKVLFPYATNYNYISHVNDIEEEEDGTVSIRIGDDVMAYQVKDEVKCKGENKIGEDFNEVLGNTLEDTNYPLPFDWGCELLGSQISFCQALNEVQCELAAVGGDVCTLTSTSSSERFPSTMKIVNMTGIFQQIFPFLEETVPNESFEAEFINREHTTGIKYPCLTR